MNKLLSWPKGRPCLDLSSSGGICSLWVACAKRLIATADTPTACFTSKTLIFSHPPSLFIIVVVAGGWQRGLFVYCVRFFGLHTMNKLFSWPKGRPCLDLCCSGGINEDTTLISERQTSQVQSRIIYTFHHSPF